MNAKSNGSILYTNIIILCWRPVSRYYNLLGADNSGLAFLEEKDLKEYFRLYEKFENEWITVIDQPGCRAQSKEKLLKYL